MNTIRLVRNSAKALINPREMYSQLDKAQKPEYFKIIPLLLCYGFIYISLHWIFILKSFSYSSIFQILISTVGFLGAFIIIPVGLYFLTNIIHKKKDIRGIEIGVLYLIFVWFISGFFELVFSLFMKKSYILLNGIEFHIGQIFTVIVGLYEFYFFCKYGLNASRKDLYLLFFIFTVTVPIMLGTYWIGAQIVHSSGLSFESSIPLIFAFVLCFLMIRFVFIEKSLSRAFATLILIMLLLFSFWIIFTVYGDPSNGNLNVQSVLLFDSSDDIDNYDKDTYILISPITLFGKAQRKTAYYKCIL
jgi:hypothetical protein